MTEKPDSIDEGRKSIPVWVWETMLQRIDFEINARPGYWESQEHFIRKAIAHYFWFLENERKYEKR